MSNADKPSPHEIYVADLLRAGKKSMSSSCVIFAADWLDASDIHGSDRQDGLGLTVTDFAGQLVKFIFIQYCGLAMVRAFYHPGFEIHESVI